MKYPVVIHKEENTEFGVSFPDLPGCITAGITIEDALEMAVEAAELYIEDVLLEGEPIPVSGTIEDYLQHPDFSDGIFWSLIDIDLTKLSDRTKRINITVPERLLAMIDAHAEKINQPRSAFMVSASIEQVVGTSVQSELTVEKLTLHYEQKITELNRNVSELESAMFRILAQNADNEQPLQDHDEDEEYFSENSIELTKDGNLVS